MNSKDQVNPLYLIRSDLHVHRAAITKMGTSEINHKKYAWIELNETIFHPKGGGQPPDEGTINGIAVVHVHKEMPDKNRLDQFEIYHCFEEHQSLPFKEGDVVELKLNPTLRQLHSRLHTAGHLVAEATMLHYPYLQANQGNHYPNNSYVRFKILDGTINNDPEKIKEQIVAQIESWINEDLPVSDLLHPGGLRTVKITHEWSPCGGTHVQRLQEVGAVAIPNISINRKEGTLTVKYELK